MLASLYRSGSGDDHSSGQDGGLRRVASHALLDFGDEELLAPQQVSFEHGSPDLDFKIGTARDMGRREHMEDRCLVKDLSDRQDVFPGSKRVVIAGVFDGHGGSEAAEHLVTSFVSRLLEAIVRIRGEAGTSPVTAAPAPAAAPAHAANGSTSPASSAAAASQQQPAAMRRQSSGCSTCSVGSGSSPLAGQAHSSAPFSSSILSAFHAAGVHAAGASSLASPRSRLASVSSADIHAACQTSSSPLQPQHPQPQPLRSSGSAGSLTGSGSASAAEAAAAAAAAAAAGDCYGTALRSTLVSLESDLLAREYHSGSTALICLMVDCSLYLANVGDCRAVVCADAEALPLTWDHKPSCNKRERERLLQAGAHLSSDGYVHMSADNSVPGVDSLMLSRAMGGVQYKRYGRRQHHHGRGGQHHLQHQHGHEHTDHHHEELLHMQPQHHQHHHRQHHHHHPHHHQHHLDRSHSTSSAASDSEQQPPQAHGLPPAPAAPAPAAAPAAGAAANPCNGSASPSAASRSASGHADHLHPHSAASPQPHPPGLPPHPGSGGARVRFSASTGGSSRPPVVPTAVAYAADGGSGLARPPALVLAPPPSDSGDLLEQLVQASAAAASAGGAGAAGSAAGSAAGFAASSAPGSCRSPPISLPSPFGVPLQLAPLQPPSPPTAAVDADGQQQQQPTSGPAVASGHADAGGSSTGGQRQQQQQHESDQEGAAAAAGGAGGGGGVVIAEPDIFQYSIHADSEFLVMASDGVWDVMRNSEVVRTVRAALMAHKENEAEVAALAAQALITRALALRSGDNMAVVVVRFSSREMAPPTHLTNSRLPFGSMRRAQSMAGM